jgi:hypothetical protein
MPIVTASSFADPNDVAAYRRAIAQGKTPAEALKVGDNGIGKWGDQTAGNARSSVESNGSLVTHSTTPFSAWQLRA